MHTLVVIYFENWEEKNEKQTWHYILKMLEHNCIFIYISYVILVFVNIDVIIRTNCIVAYQING
jgi:hypothetical protein